MHIWVMRFPAGPPSRGITRKVTPMAKTQDFTAVYKDFLGALPFDTKAVENMFKSQSALAEKMSAVAIEAARKSTDLSAKWTADTLGKLQTVSKAKAEPADYAKSVTDFASASAEVAAENMAAFAEIAKKVQTETLEIMLNAGKTLSEEVTAAATKATAEVSAAAKKAAN